MVRLVDFKNFPFKLEPKAFAIHINGTTTKDGMELPITGYIHNLKFSDGSIALIVMNTKSPIDTRSGLGEIASALRQNKCVWEMSIEP